MGQLVIGLRIFFSWFCQNETQWNKVNDVYNSILIVIITILLFLIDTFQICLLIIKDQNNVIHMKKLWLYYFLQFSLSKTDNSSWMQNSELH